jgi:23S rRNA (guanine745-N1)-methyltransferase
VPLARVAPDLRCPVCGRPLSAAGRTLRCARAHTFDVSRQGVVTLMSPGRRRPTGDDAGMVSARAAVLGAKHFAPLTTALAETAAGVGDHDAPLVLDVGAGTGHHLASVLDALPDARGIAFDASTPALRRAARAGERIAAIAGDVWSHIPLSTATADLVLNVFAPRNAGEFARVLRPGGTLIVAIPSATHLRELATLHPLSVDPRKHQRLYGRLEAAFDLADVRRVAWNLRLAPRDATDLVRMGPAARHLSEAHQEHLRRLPAAVSVTAAVELHVFRRAGPPSR